MCPRTPLCSHGYPSCGSTLSHLSAHQCVLKPGHYTPATALQPSAGSQASFQAQDGAGRWATVQPPLSGPLKKGKKSLDNATGKSSVEMWTGKAEWCRGVIRGEVFSRMTVLSFDVAKARAHYTIAQAKAKEMRG